MPISEVNIRSNKQSFSLAFIFTIFSVANGRRGDFEILGYNMLQWMCGRLPWESNLTDPEYVASQKNKYMSSIPLLISECFPAKNAPG